MTPDTIFITALTITTIATPTAIYLLLTNQPQKAFTEAAINTICVITLVITLLKAW